MKRFITASYILMRGKTGWEANKAANGHAMADLSPFSKH
jgi:hypothetical protein